MEEINNQDVSLKEIQTRNKKKKAKRGVLILLNAILACYLLYCISDGINEFYQKYFVNHDDQIISIHGYSTAKSLEIYDKVIDKDENGNYLTTEIVDFSFYAGYLNFKSDTSNINLETGELHYSSFDSYTLRRIDEKNKYEKIEPYVNVKSSLRNSIFLFDETLKEGDYIIYPYQFGYENGYDNKQVPLKLESQDGVFKTYYSPFINNTRRKFEIKSKASSPALVLTITNIYTPEFTYNDLAILYKNDADKNKINEIFDSDKFSKKFVSSNDDNKKDLIALYQANATVTLILEDGQDITISHYINISSLNETVFKNGSLSEDYFLQVYDEDFFIRELGGSLFNAGSALPSEDGSTKWLNGYAKSYDMGSLVVKVGIESLEQLTTLLQNVVNYNFS